MITVHYGKYNWIFFTVINTVLKIIFDTVSFGVLFCLTGISKTEFTLSETYNELIRWQNIITIKSAKEPTGSLYERNNIEHWKKYGSLILNLIHEEL